MIGQRSVEGSSPESPTLEGVPSLDTSYLRQYTRPPPEISLGQDTDASFDAGDPEADTLSCRHFSGCGETTRPRKETRALRAGDFHAGHHTMAPSPTPPFMDASDFHPGIKSSGYGAPPEPWNIVARPQGSRLLESRVDRRYRPVLCLHLHGRRREEGGGRGRCFLAAWRRSFLRDETSVDK